MVEGEDQLQRRFVWSLEGPGSLHPYLRRPWCQKWCSMSCSSGVQAENNEKLKLGILLLLLLSPNSLTRDPLQRWKTVVEDFSGRWLD